MSIFNKADREQLVDLLEDYFDEQSLWIVGQFRAYCDAGMPKQRALRRTRKDFFRLVVDELDTRADWERAKRAEVRRVLEAVDGFVFEALLTGLLNLVTARILGTGTGFAGLLAVADSALHAAQDAIREEPEEEAGPTVIKRAPGRVHPGKVSPIPDWMPSKVDEGDEAVEVEAVESSASTVKGRLGSLLRRDREVLGDARAETAELPVDLFPPDDATDEVPDETSPEDLPEPLRARLPGFPTGGFTSGLLGVFKRGEK